VFTSRDYLEKASASLRWYPGVGPEADSAIQAVLETVLAKTDTAPRVLSLRDYHAENLIWLPGRDGLRRVGLLDFQDAVAGHPAYDLVSLLWDVRRDVSPQTRERMMAHYVARSGFSEAAFLRDAAILNAQRNLRILTQFARLVVRDGKPRYLAMMPRVWSNLQSALRHPDLADLSQVVHRHVAPPTSDLIERLSRACQTAPVE
jgi:aminoglycoside/choline kinase family phosphotransferase